jgi:hypothetical protein
VTDPNTYKGSHITLVGRIFLDPNRLSDKIVFQMYVSPENNDWNTIVAGVDRHSDVKRGDYVRVEGTVMDMLDGTNSRSFGRVSVRTTFSSGSLTMSGR